MEGYKKQRAIIFNIPDIYNFNENFDLIKYLAHKCNELGIYDFKMVSITKIYKDKLLIIIDVIRGE